MRIIYCTFPSLEIAQDFSKRAVMEGRAACANILPAIQSFYKWEGKLEDSKEYIVLFKLSTEKAPSLVNWLTQKHPYETPCIITIAPESVNEPYLNWLKA